jgi:hypothetical protein
LVSRLGAQTTHLNGLGVEEIVAVGGLILSICAGERAGGRGDVAGEDPGLALGLDKEAAPAAESPEAAP